MWKKIFLLSLLNFLAGVLFAQGDDIPERPSPPKLVNNLSVKAPDFLSAAETADLEQKLVDFANTSSNQITVVIVDTLYGYDVNDFSTRLGEKWRVGQEKFDNGVVLLVVDPLGKAGSRDVYIAVGYGLEPVIPDLVSKRIVENEIIPEFKNGNYYAGLNKGTDKLMGFALGEFNTDEYANKSKGGKIPYAIIAIVLILIFMRLFRGGSGMTMTRYGRTYWGGSFGGFGGGGGGGGGFGGFGGGSFGGGGAGGKW